MAGPAIQPARHLARPELLLQAGLAASASSTSTARRKRHRRTTYCAAADVFPNSDGTIAYKNDPTQPSSPTAIIPSPAMLGCCPAPPPSPQLHRASQSRRSCHGVDTVLRCSAAPFSRLPVSTAAQPRAGHAPQTAPIAGWLGRLRGPPAACS